MVLTDFVNWGDMANPPLTKRAVMTANCNGVARTYPWPIPASRVSPWCQG